MRIKSSVVFFFTMLLPLGALAATPVLTPITPVDSRPNTPAGIAASANLVDLFTQAQTWYDQRETPTAVEKAVDLYTQILAQEPRNSEALWRLARCYWWLGDHATADNKIAWFELGKTSALHAQTAAPARVDGYYWFGVCEGRAAEIRGILNSLFAVDPIRQAMLKVISLDEKHGAAHHILGVLYRKAPGWPLSCGNIDTSLEHARLAVEYSPDEVLFRVDLAKTLLAKNQKEEAKKILKEALELPGLPDKQPETQTDKKTAKKVLETLK